MDQSACDPIERPQHPWDIEHPYIERVPGGWRRKGDLSHFVRYSPDDLNVRNHPVLFLLYRRRSYDLERRLRWFRSCLRHKFECGIILTDGEIAEIPPPKRWTKEVLGKWPDLLRGRDQPIIERY